MFKSRKTYQERMSSIDKNVFEKYKHHIQKGKLLKVGVGRGFSNKLIEQENKHIVHLDIHEHPESLVKTTTYDGNTIPFADNTFDCVLCIYTLHHAKDSRSLLQELFRVSKKKVIVYETTYSNIFSKLSLAYFDWRANFLTDQPVTIEWNSYFRKKEVLDICKKHKVIEFNISPRRGYFKEFMVFEKH